MQLLESLNTLDMSKRLHLVADSSTLYIDLHGVNITTADQVVQVPRQ